MATFHFSRDPPPEEVFTDVQALNKFKEEVRWQFQID
jgi:hypothetical protein